MWSSESKSNFTEGRSVIYNYQQKFDEKYCKPCHDLRYYIAKELLQTEENYVTTLSMILKVHKKMSKIKINCINVLRLRILCCHKILIITKSQWFEL